MDKAILINKLKEYAPIKENKLVERTVDVKDMTILRLRDSLIGIGKILEEDLEANVYVLSVNAGAADMNSAVVAVHLEDDKLYFLGYAKEGLINQHTADKALEKIASKVN